MADLLEWQESLLHEGITKPVGFVIMVPLLDFQFTQHLVLEMLRKASQSG